MVRWIFSSLNKFEEESFMRVLLSFLLANLMILTSATAYVPEHLQETPVEVETAILLSEDGVPRCWIGKSPGEDLSDFDALEECDEDDELYTRTILGTEEIQLGMALIPFSGGKLGALATGTTKMVRARPVFSGTLLNFLTTFFGGCYAHHGDNQKKSAILMATAIGYFNLLYSKLSKLSAAKMLLAMASGGTLSYSTIDFVCANAD